MGSSVLGEEKIHLFRKCVFFLRLRWLLGNGALKIDILEAEQPEMEQGPVEAYVNGHWKTRVRRYEVIGAGTSRG